MPHDLVLAGIYFPPLLVVFIAGAAVVWLLDLLAGRFGLYRHVWHPPLFRLALFVCVVAGAALLLIRY